MDTVDKIIDDIKKNFQVKQVSGTTDFFDGGDVDFFVPKGFSYKIADFLQKNGFVVSTRYGKGVYARKFIDEKLYHLDFAEEPLPFYFFSDIQSTEKFFEDMWADRDLEKFFRYILQMRNYKQKFTLHINKNFEKYGKYLSDTTYTTKPLFKNNISVEDVVGVMQKNPLSFFRAFSFSRLLRLFKEFAAFHWRKLGQGGVVAFVGADGAGKTTALEYMSRSNGTHVIYMGDINFKLQSFYEWLHQQNIFVARTSYFFMYIENWLRYAWIFYKKSKGDLVYTDRWPGFNQYIGENSKLAKLHKVLYKFFPQPNRYVFLSGNPNIIHNRKPELTVEKIDRIQKTLRIVLEGKDYIEVETHDFDTAMNEILHFLADKEKINTLYI